MVEKVKPILIEIDGETVNPAAAPPIPDDDHAVAQGQTANAMLHLAGRPPSRLTRWLARVAIGLFVFGLSVWTWNWVGGLITSSPTLGYLALALVSLFAVLCIVLIVRELAGFARLARLDRLKNDIDAVYTGGDLRDAQSILTRLQALYRNRPDLDWHRARLKDQLSNQFDPEGVLDLAEVELMVPLDQQAIAQIEAASRQVATATALIPLAFADILIALTANVRMIRQIASIYGGRTGMLGNLRLARAVVGHLVATGAVAIGDDLIGSVAGGTVLSKLSRRFGEGIINGALTARVGVAAMDLCRPLPFRAAPKPTVTAIVGRALAGLFSKAK